MRIERKAKIMQEITSAYANKMLRSHSFRAGHISNNTYWRLRFIVIVYRLFVMGLCVQVHGNDFWKAYNADFQNVL